MPRNKQFYRPARDRRLTYTSLYSRQSAGEQISEAIEMMRRMFAEKEDHRRSEPVSLVKKGGLIAVKTNEDERADGGTAAT